jgi:zinc protease
MNAGTSYDYTYYHVLVPASRAASAIETLADIGVNASLGEAPLELEKEIVLEEMRLGDDNPNRLLLSKVYEAVFEGHPYGRPVIGTPDVIGRLTREQLVAFYRRHYVPEAFTLVVVGRVDPQAVVDAATRALGRLPRARTRRLPPPVVPGPETRSLAVSRAAAHAYLGLGWPAPRLDHTDAPALDLLVAVLGQGRASRLTQSLTERLRLVHAVTSGYSALEAGGLVSITAQTTPEALPSVESQILKDVRRLADDGVTDAEMERALSVAEARRELQLETVEGRAFMLGHAETTWRIDEALAYLDRLRSVTPAQMRAAARRYLDPERYARVRIAPSGTR